MKTKIVTDSTCDLPEELLRERDITVLPLHISKGEKSYLDGLQIRPKDIYDHVNAGGEICGTSAVNVNEFLQCIKAVHSFYDAVIVITIGSSFSSCYQNACLAAQEYPNIYVVDSGNLSTGQGMLVVKAAQLAEEQLPPEEICARLEQIKPRIRSSFILDRLDYLQKGGRCSSAAALGANLLQLKPCVEIKDGRMVVGKKYRGNFHKAVRKYVQDQLTAYSPIDKDLVILAVADDSTVLPDRDAAAQAIADNAAFHASIHTLAGCTVACHCGPTTLGMTFVQE